MVAAGVAVAGWAVGDRILLHDRMYDTAADENASAADVVDAGRAVDAAVSGDTTMVAYTVHNDDDEGRTAAAWRLYDPDGNTVAHEHAGVTDEGFARPEVTAVPGGFLVEDERGPTWLVTEEGDRTKVTRSRAPMPARPGDVVVADDFSRLLYRPSTRKLLGPHPKPLRNPQGWTVTADGTAWMQGPGTRDEAGPFFRSVEGSPWRPVAGYDQAPDEYVNGLGLAAVGEHVVVPVTRSHTVNDVGLTGLLVRRAASPAAQPWTRIDVRDARGRDWFDLQVQALDETTVLVGTWGDAPFLVDVDGGDVRELEEPSGEGNWAYEAQDGRIFAFHDAHADAWLTEDTGGRWSRLPH